MLLTLLAARIHAHAWRIMITRMSIELPASAHEWAQHLTKRDGGWVDQFISTALAEKMSVLEVDAYVRQRAGA